MKELHIRGMGCEHCRKAVLDAVSPLPGMKDPQVDVQQGTLRWEESAPVNLEALKEAVRKAGYEPV